MKAKLQTAFANLQIIFCITALSVLTAAAADVQFVFGDFTATPKGLKRLWFYPVVVDSSNNVQLVTRDRISILTGTNGSVTITNVQVGTYRSELFGTSSITTNLFEIPATNGVISAKDWQIQGTGFLLWEEAGVPGGKILFQP